MHIFRSVRITKSVGLLILLWNAVWSCFCYNVTCKKSLKLSQTLHVSETGLVTSVIACCSFWKFHLKKICFNVNKFHSCCKPQNITTLYTHYIPLYILTTFHFIYSLHSTFHAQKYPPWRNARCLVVLLVWPNHLALIKWRLIKTCSGLVAYHLWSISTLHTKVWPCHARLA